MTAGVRPPVHRVVGCEVAAGWDEGSFSRISRIRRKTR